MRRAASWCQPLQCSVAPRGACTAARSPTRASTVESTAVAMDGHGIRGRRRRAVGYHGRVRRRLGTAAVGLAAATLLAWAGTGTAAAAVHLQRIMHGLASPVYLTSPRGDGRLFVVEKCGVIRVDVAGHVVRRPFLDISRIVSCSDEEGLLSMAFDPHFRTNRR